MTKADQYRMELRKLEDWEPYLLESSGLPGPRANLELAQAVADEGERPLFERYLAETSERAPANSPREFLAFCGVLGLGRLLAEGDTALLERLRGLARDPRWRVREAVAMALQRLGDVDMEKLEGAMRLWAQGTPLEQRAAAAALCEPRLLREPRDARAALEVLEAVTRSMERAGDRGGEGFLALKKGLAYCWSVAVAALPEQGKPLMERWMAAADEDIRWVMRENLKKARLRRMDAAWVESWLERLGA